MTSRLKTGESLTFFYSVGLSYRPASLSTLASRYDKSMPESTLSPQTGTMNFASVLDSTSVWLIVFIIQIRTQAVPRAFPLLINKPVDWGGGGGGVGG